MPPSSYKKHKTRTPTHTLSNRESKALREIVKLDGEILAATSSVGQFLERYLVSEAVARKLISNKTGKPCPQILNFSSIQSAAKHFHWTLSIHPELIESVFRSGDGLRDSKTPRQLRNSIVHEISKVDCVEIRTRQNDLMKLMQRWLDHFV
jgi:hypothetical protein